MTRKCSVGRCNGSYASMLKKGQKVNMFRFPKKGKELEKLACGIAQ